MKYRREIDGLRAVAVLPVVLFHAGLSAFAGGFVGVDVFFVISGYLITTVILGEQALGRFTLTGFYERRARRILPALAFVILVTVPLAWRWLLPGDLVDLAKSMMAVAGFASNILFWKQSGYFDAAESKPLLHTWSLAVEEQFYLLFPLLLMLLARMSRRTLRAVLGAGALLSLAVAQWGAVHRPVGSFYLLPTRAWELLLGALVALVLLDRDEPEHSTVADPASAVGLLLIAGSAALYGRGTPFPGVYALAPTVGTAMIILWATPRTVVGRLLGSRLLVGIGLVSYSVYLWHQPLFALARLRRADIPSDAEFLALAALAVVLGVLTWRFVERPFRDASRVSRRGIFTVSAVAMLLIAALGALGVAKEGFPGRFSLPADVAATLVRPDKPCFYGAVRGPVAQWTCPLGARSGPPSFVVIGDSHARALADAFDDAATRAGVSGVLATAGACTPFVGIHALRNDQDERNCHELNARMLEYVRAQGIRTVILVARWPLYTDGGYDGKNLSFIGTRPDAGYDKASSRAAFESGLAATVDAYAAIGVRPMVLAAVPQQRADPRSVYYKLASDGSADAAATILAVSLPVSEHRRLQRWVTERFAKYDGRPGGIRLVSLDSIYCGRSVCSMGEATRSNYFDADHLSLSGARLAVPVLTALLGADADSPRFAAPVRPR